MGRGAMDENEKPSSKASGAPDSTPDAGPESVPDSAEATAVKEGAEESLAEGQDVPLAEDIDETAVLLASEIVQAGAASAPDPAMVHDGYGLFRPFDVQALPAVSYGFDLKPLDDSENTARLGLDSAFVPVVAVFPQSAGAGAPGPEPGLVPTDPLFGQQWHLQAINVQSVWDDYTGAGVTVALIDDGVEYTHPDLAANYSTALDYDARNGDNDAFTSSSSDRHGTTTAGTVAAVQGNGTGVVGVAYEATIAGLRMGFGSAGGTSQIADNFQHAVNFDVVNNSWGYSGFFPDNFNSGSFAASAAALENAATNGRGGLGTVIVFSAGNSRTSGNDTNYHNFQNSKYVIAVAATDSSGDYASFSTPGAALLLSAPGVGVATTDRVGSLGYSSGDYVSVSGTSFSAPIVSGVVALMLEANPDLGYRDVQEILAYSSTKTDPTNARWTMNDADNWNGGGLHFSPDYGFGLVDAHAAVRLAEVWTAQSTAANMQMASASRSTSAVIPDNNATGISQSVTIAPGILIDKVEVDLSISHGWIGDLRVVLIAPDGTESVLVNRPGINPDTNSGGGSSQNNINFTLTSNQFWGETSGGQWTLVVSDNAGGDVGTLNNWTLRVYGDLDTNNDTYVYTDEYAGFTGVANASHRLLTDSNGGNDTINAAAVTSNSHIDLTPGAVSSIAGNTLTIDAGALIENAFGGDGNDVLIGNSADNILLGGRGADSLTGGVGDDMLGGGVGIDTAFYSGFFADFSIIVLDATHVTVTDNVTAGGDEGTDSLADIELLQFADQLYALTVVPANNAPVAGTDNAVTNEDNAVVVSVLSNDTDADSDLLSVTGVSNGAHGTVTINPGNTTVTYTPAANYNGPDSFTYTASDGKGGSTIGTVNVIVNPVNDPPVPGTDSATTDEDNAVIVSVLANDTDIDGGGLSVSGVTNGAHGTVAINPGNTTVTYTPAANYNGPDSFTYTVSDGNGGTAIGTVNVTVDPVNDAPLAGNDSATTDEDTPVTINVLSNDTDIDGDLLTVTGAANPANGTVTINANNSITYTPNAGFSGGDSFDYSISDGNGGTSSATVALTVSAAAAPPPPPPPPPEPVTLIDENFNSNAGGFVYHDDEFLGTSQPRYESGGRVSSSGFTGGALRVILGGVNNRSITDMSGGFERTFTLDEASAVTLAFHYNLTQTRYYEPDEFSQVLVAVDGTLYGRDGQNYVDQIVGDGNGGPNITTDWQLVTADLGTLDAGTHTLAIGGFNNAKNVRNERTVILIDDVTVTGGADSTQESTSPNDPPPSGNDPPPPENDPPPANDPPVAADDQASAVQDTSVVIDVLANDSDPNGDLLSVTGTTNPAHGTTTLNLDGTVTYTPLAGYTGADSFDYFISDGQGGTDQASVALDVSAALSQPVTLIDEDFSRNSGGFTYFDDAFFNTQQPRYESGSWASTGGGVLRVILGGVNNRAIDDMSGGFQHEFDLANASDVTLTFHFNMTQTRYYESDEFSQVLVSVDGTLYGVGGNDYVAQINGDGNGGSNITTDWQTVTLDLGTLAAGSHTLVVGGYNNAKDTSNERTTILIDDVNLGAGFTTNALAFDPLTPLGDTGSADLSGSSLSSLSTTSGGTALSLSDVLGDSDPATPSGDADTSTTDLFAAAAPLSLSTMVNDDAAAQAAQTAA